LFFQNKKSRALTQRIFFNTPLRGTQRKNEKERKGNLTKRARK
jgi:hypothetical protein